MEGVSSTARARFPAFPPFSSFFFDLGSPVNLGFICLWRRTELFIGFLSRINDLVWDIVETVSVVLQQLINEAAGSIPPSQRAQQAAGMRLVPGCWHCRSVGTARTEQVWQVQCRYNRYGRYSMDMARMAQVWWVWCKDSAGTADMVREWWLWWRNGG